MFIATMYSYGKDPLSVGVDGIVGCMAVFLKYGDMLYAIHLPDNSPATNKLGRDAFAKYVKQEEPQFAPGNAHIYFVLNNNNRLDMIKEVKGLCVALKIQSAEIVRLRDNLGPVNAPGAAAVLCERIGDVCVMKYRDANEVNWQTGGVVRAGYYHNASMDGSYKINSAVSQGWHVVTAANSTLRFTKLG